jgi:hypothetical protein
MAVCKSISAGDIEGGFRRFKASSPIPEAQISQLSSGISKVRPEIIAKYGKSLGVELLGTAQVGKSLLRVIVLEKMEFNGIIWIFSFYKSNSGWLAIAIRSEKADEVWSLFQGEGGKSFSNSVLP